MVETSIYSIGHNDALLCNIRLISLQAIRKSRSNYLNRPEFLGLYQIKINIAGKTYFTVSTQNIACHYKYFVAQTDRRFQQHTCFLLKLIAASFFICGFVDMNRHLLCRSVTPFKMDTEADIVIVCCEFPKYVRSWNDQQNLVIQKSRSCHGLHAWYPTPHSHLAQHKASVEQRHWPWTAIAHTSLCLPLRQNISPVVGPICMEQSQSSIRLARNFVPD